MAAQRGQNPGDQSTRAEAPHHNDDEPTSAVGDPARRQDHERHERQNDEQPQGDAGGGQQDFGAEAEMELSSLNQGG